MVNPPEPTQAEAVLSYQIFPLPDSPTLGVLRIDTESAQHWFLLTRKTAALLSEVAAKLAGELQPMQ